MRITTLIGLLLLVLVAVAAPDSAAQVTIAATFLEPGFEELPSIGGLDHPIAFDWAPLSDGRMFVGEKRGTLRIVRDGVLLRAPAVSLPTNSYSERGLLGVAVDPQFPSRPYVYVYYTHADGPKNRVSRFTMAGDTARDELVLVDDIPADGGRHMAGDLHFGLDGLLYASTGDGGSHLDGRAQNLDSLGGKILRIDPQTGRGVPNNPFWTGGANPTRDRIWAYGLRNPFRFAIQPGTGTMYIADVGAAGFEEIDLGVRGANYGWPRVEGPKPSGMSGLTYPFFSYPHQNSTTFANCRAIIGGAFATGAHLGGRYAGSYFFADYFRDCEKIWRVEPGSPPRVTLFASNVGQPVHMAFGPDGMLYYSDFGDNKIRRVRYTQGNRAPVVHQASAQPPDGPLPLRVTFTARASDPDGDALSYRWDFGDGQSSTAPSTTHDYTEARNYQAWLTVSDNRGGSTKAGPFTLRPGNLPPTAKITAPVDGATFQPGEQIVLQGSGNDPDDGSLAGASLSWEVRRWHGTDHFHPWVDSASGATITTSMPEPEDLASVTTSYLEVRLTATDSRGATHTDTIRIRPSIVPLTFQTEPPGLIVQIEGVPYRAPVTIQSARGWKFVVEGPFQTTGDCDGYKAAPYTYTTPAAPATETITFSAVQAQCLYVPSVRR